MLSIIWKEDFFFLSRIFIFKNTSNGSLSCQESLWVSGLATTTTAAAAATTKTSLPALLKLLRRTECSGAPDRHVSAQAGGAAQPRKHKFRGHNRISISLTRLNFVITHAAFLLETSRR